MIGLLGALLVAPFWIWLERPSVSARVKQMGLVVVSLIVLAVGGVLHALDSDRWITGESWVRGLAIPVALWLGAFLWKWFRLRYWPAPPTAR